jgi:signal transduction histidine kinase
VADPEDVLRDAEIAGFDAFRDAPGGDLQALVELTAQVCDVPYAAINLITADKQHSIATVGVPRFVCAREDSMCAVVVDEAAPVVVADAREDERFCDNPLVDGRIARARFYASAGLTTQRGVTIGRLCVFDTVARTMTARQAGALQMLADRVVDLLELRRRSVELEESLAELTRTQEELHRSNKRLSYFAGQVSHDLRTPLTAMMLNTESVLLDPDLAEAPHLRAPLQAVLQAGTRMSGLIDDMLSFAQVGASLRMVEVDMGAVMASVAEDLAPQVAERSGTLDVGALPSVVGDERHLYSVLLNLVSNALKFTRPGVPPVVQVRAVRLPERWRFEVTDNGTGVPEAQRATVFLPFTRGSSDQSGTGIGLATARRVVEAHGGRIGLEDASGGGTVAWFELPD